MSNAEHLIENVIYGMWKGMNIDAILDQPFVQDELKLTGIMPGYIYAMAQHVVYGLYDGKFPDFPEVC